MNENNNILILEKQFSGDVTTYLTHPGQYLSQSLSMFQTQLANYQHKHIGRNLTSLEHHTSIIEYCQKSD